MTKGPGRRSRQRLSGRLGVMLSEYGTLALLASAVLAVSFAGRLLGEDSFLPLFFGVGLAVVGGMVVVVIVRLRDPRVKGHFAKLRRDIAESRKSGADGEIGGGDRDGRS